MKKAVISSVLMALCILALAQVPESFNYQVVVRDGTSNNPLVNQNVSFKMSILKGSISGESQYSELHIANTGALGIVNLVIGTGTGKIGNITTIDWGAGLYFLKVEIDKTGGSSYVEMGTIQLLSVPYAMHAKSVTSYDETDPNFLASPAYGITSGNITNWNSIQWSEIISIPAGFSDGVDNDTWTNNTKSSAGIVTAGGSNFNKLWKTDGSGNPGWGTLVGSDIPDLDWSKITIGKPTTLAGYGITDGISRSQIIKGIIDGNAKTIITGEGFTFEYIDTGHYIITFSHAFSMAPVCVANDNGSANYIIGTTPTTTSVDIWVRAHNGSEGNTTVSFIVIGQN